jgi:hypothetical protein
MLAKDRLAGPMDPAAALSFFDSLAGFEPEFLIGQWRGVGVPTGHPLDRTLEPLGWYGKRFETPDKVHPLLFEPAQGACVRSSRD